MDVIEFLETEHQRLVASLQEIQIQQAQLGRDEIKVMSELRALQDYMDVKAGKNAELVSKNLNPQASLKRTAPQKLKTENSNSFAAQVLSLIRASPDGISRQVLVDKLGIKGNAKKMQYLSNLVSSLKRTGAIRPEKGFYVPQMSAG